jgi:hypothetical protein
MRRHGARLVRALLVHEVVVPSAGYNTPLHEVVEPAEHAHARRLQKTPATYSRRRRKLRNTAIFATRRSRVAEHR